MRDTEKRSDAVAGGEITPSPSAGDAGSAAPEADDWWDVELAIAMSRAEIELHFMRPTIAQIRSPQASRRAEAYGQLLQGLPRTLESRTATNVMQEIVSGCYALDPDEEAARTLRQRLREKIPQADEPLPANVQSWQRGFAAVQMASSAATRAGVSEPRAEAMRRDLGESLGLAIDATWDKTQLRRQAAGALARSCYRVMTAAAPSRTADVQVFHPWLAGEGERWLDQTVLDQLEAQFLTALLAADETVWRQHQRGLLRIVASEDPAVLLQAVELLERSSDESLQYYLAVGLLRRIGEANAGQTPEEVAAAVRKEFGFREAAGGRPGQRWQNLQSKAEDQLKSLRADASQPVGLLEETIRLARFSTLGCILSQGEFGHGAFDQLWEAEAPSLDKEFTGLEPEAPTETAPDARARILNRFIDSLARATQATQRISYLRAITENGHALRELEPQSADVIAKYLLSPKTDEEREAISTLIPQVGRWKTVRLAAADLIAETSLRRELVQEVVAGLLNTTPTESDDGDWKRHARETLMRSVLEGGFAATNSSPYDTAQNTLLQLYQAQAKAEGVPADAYSDAASPTAVLPALIEHVGARLAAKAGDEVDRAFLGRLPHELAAAEYLGDNDLRRLALYERLWLRVLAIDVAVAHSDRAPAAQDLLSKLDESDRKSSDVLLQLRDGQAALLRMWLLYSS
jgi:hypothetical protein